MVVMSRASSGFAGCSENAILLESQIIERRKLNVIHIRGFPTLIYNNLMYKLISQHEGNYDSTCTSY